MLIYSAHIPHSPVLIRSVSRSKLAIFRKIKNALAEIADDIHARKVETIIFITPQGRGLSRVFVAQISQRYKLNLGGVGDFTTSGEIAGNVALTQQITDRLGPAWPIKSHDAPVLDVATSAAILQLGNKDSAWSVLPITYALLPNLELFNFGLVLREALENDNRRLALISLGDLSRTKEKHHAQGTAWDETLIHALKDKKTDIILATSLAQVDSFHVSGWRSLVVVLGALSEINYEVDVLSYQQKLGVGMMATRFIF